MTDRWLNDGLMVLALLSLSSCSRARSERAAAVRAQEVRGLGSGDVGSVKGAVGGVAERSSPPPSAILQIEPVDLTSMAANVPLRVSLHTYTPFGKSQLLQQIAGQVKIVDLASGTQVPAGITIHDEEKAAYGDLGYPTSIPAHVAVKPSVALNPEKWYELRVVMIPSGVVPASTGLRRTEGGGASSRFSPGSHPTLAAVRWCKRGGGGHTVRLLFSENVRADSTIKEKLRVEHPDAQVGCKLSLPPSGLVRTLDFVCTGGEDGPGSLKVWLGQAIESPSGGKLEMPLRGQGDLSKAVNGNMWREYDSGCSVWEPDADGGADAVP